ADQRILTNDRCYHCHGPDAAKGQKGGLRLDDEASAKADLYALKRQKKGKKPLSAKEAAKKSRYAVVAGHPEHSSLIERIFTDDEDDVMPPSDSIVKPLSAEEKSMLRQWIKQGAKWEKHWAYTQPKKQTVTVKNKNWGTNQIDHYIMNKLEEQALNPSPRATKETLIRRLSLDLRGIPPELSEIDDFLSDKSPQAYEKVVDKFLADKSCGERLAVEWLDVASYGDSQGLFSDPARSTWPWRDWVVKAFNDNKPFDTFITEQVAGDLLPNPTIAQQVATGFYRNNPTSHEGGIIDDEYLIQYAGDRVRTTSMAFLGMSLDCASCHDHKFDPLTQKNFYEMSGFFRNIDEKGKVDKIKPGPFIHLGTKEQLAQQKKLVADLAKAKTEQKAVLKKKFKAPKNIIASRIRISHSGKGRLYINEISFKGYSDRAPKISGSAQKIDYSLLVDGNLKEMVKVAGNPAFIEMNFPKNISFNQLVLHLDKKDKRFLKNALVECWNTKGELVISKMVNKSKELMSFLPQIKEEIKMNNCVFHLN
ncbi:MAG: DUF1549 domain-containing protein, partial [Lentisphaeraceae bacterium]|nr:DUF1549 domain-containing protein [Lentisphaeraceae bacterium]